MKVKNISGAPLFIAGGAVYPYSEELLESGFRKTRFNDEYNMFRVFGTGEHKKLIVPRNMASAGGNDLRTDGSKVKFDSKFKPRNSEQSRVIAEAVGLLTKNINFMLDFPIPHSDPTQMNIITKKV